MDSDIIVKLQFATRQVTIYLGIFILVIGVVGGLLNVLVFTTLKTFRKTPSVFYLTTAAIVNIGQLLTSLLIRILSVGFHIDLTAISWFCKIRAFFVQFFALISLTCMSLATIEQFISMSHRQLSNLQIAYRNIIVTCIISSIHGILMLIYFDTPNGVCVIINTNYGRYFTYFYFPVLLGFAPIIIMTTFALIAFINTRTRNNRQVHIERLSRDRQITAMVLVQVVFIVILTLPYVVTNIYTLSIVTTDKVVITRTYLANATTILFYYGSYADSFYIFCCVSKRFRKQVIYVLIDIHLKRFQQRTNNLNKNQVAPQIEIEEIRKKSRQQISITSDPQTQD